MSEDKDKKVISIVSGRPVTEKPEVDPFIVETLERVLKDVYAGNIDQVVLITISDEAVSGAYAIVGETINPEVMFTQMELLKDDYKEYYIKSRREYDGDLTE